MECLNFYREHSNVTWEVFLTTKFVLWIDARSSTDNTFHGSGRAVEKSGILLQIEKVPETVAGDLMCYVFSLEDAVAHISVTDPSGILTIEKEGLDDCEIYARNDIKTDTHGHGGLVWT